MRLHRLEVEGFGPFRERQSVDFDAFADDGIFLIAGRTGAGKSSILDAVCFGLYGGVPRYDGGEKRLRSDQSDPDDVSEVVVEFSTPAGRFRVTRSPEYLRPAKRGGGLTKQAAAVALDEWNGSGWVGRAARAVDVAGELDEILQLSREQFLQVILLAQNRFSEFLLANSKDRQALLRRLFGTERFEDVQARFDDRRRAAEHALGARLATVGARIEEAERLIDAAQLRIETDGGVEQLSDSAGGSGAATGDGPDAAAGGDVRTAAESRRPPAVADRAEASIDDRLDELRRASSRAGYRAERRAAERDDAAALLTAADSALAALRDDKKAQGDRDRARAALARLEQEAAEIAEAGRELRDARAAEALRATIATAARARASLDSAIEAERGARAAWTSLGAGDASAEGDPDAVSDAPVPAPPSSEPPVPDAQASATAVQASATDADDAPAAEPVDGADSEASSLGAWAAERIRAMGAWERAGALETQMPALAAEREAAEQRVAEASARIEAGAVERASLPDEVRAATAARDQARRAADREADARRVRDAAAARLTAAREVVRLAQEQQAGERALAEASAELAAEQTALADLRRRRLDGFAGELASSLAEGEACPVCGSHEHPEPAVHGDPVSADDIAAAELSRDAAAARERTSADAVSELRAEAAAAASRADGRTVETAEDELAVAADELATCVEAAASVVRLDEELSRLAARIEQLEEQRAADEAESAAAREQLSLLAQRIADATAQIDEARAGFDSVAARIADVTERVQAARGLADALIERQRRAEVEAEARTELRTALEASAFDDVTGAEQSLRPLAVQDALQKRVDEHAARLGKERATLLELELLTLPEEPIDPGPAEQAAAQARTAWMAAVDAAAKADSAAQQLDGLIGSAASEHSALAEDAADYEVLRGLADAIAGRGANTRKMTLETFVLAAELEEIVQAANRRLHDMSAGRYQLRHSDALAARGAASGLGIVVHDAFTGQSRPAQSLSGGETFLGSLALALGLAEVVTSRAGGIRLDTLFIDEGFGSLDGDTLEVAMRTLDELRQGGRTVGVISHVEAMQEQIPAQLTVRATAEGPSVIETR